MNYAAAALLALGVLQMIGDLSHFPALRGLAAATVASPAPKVFSAVRGFETYSTRFFVEWTDQDGIEHSLPVTSEVYARLAGPYNRRNVYGAALAYGPVLATDTRSQPMLEAVMTYAFCGDAPLLQELGIDPTRVAGIPQVRFAPLPGTDMNHLPLILQPPCR